MKHLFLTGATGRLGRTIQADFTEEWVMHPCSRSRGVDLCSAKPGEVFPEQTDFCLNCAAVSSRGGCVKNPSEAFLLNSVWPARLAEYCIQNGKRLVHISTDLVYSGGIPPYTESSPAVPKSLYGWTKLLGDRAVLRRNPGALVVRTSVLVGKSGAVNPTFTEDILTGKAKQFHVDCFRNHTDIHLLAGYLERALGSAFSGLVLASAPYSESREAYASFILNEDITLIPAPDHLAKDLTLRPSVSLTNN